MAYYDTLIAAWNGATQPPTGVVSGTAITGGMTTQQKIVAVNSWLVVGTTRPLVVPPSVIFNACNAADLASLTTAQLQLLQLMMSGPTADASQGTVLRQVIINIFTGKTNSINGLSALAALYDSPKVPWWEFTGGLSSPVSKGDTDAAGLS